MLTRWEWLGRWCEVERGQWKITEVQQAAKEAELMLTTGKYQNIRPITIPQAHGEVIKCLAFLANSQNSKHIDFRMI